MSKRAMDLGLVILLSPLALLAVAVIGVLIRARLGRPVMFAQQRPGLHGRAFTMYKFRTMTDARDATGVLRPDAERLTPFGRWLRATSLDELPELWNVVKGEMSLVGPRPLLMEYLPLYSPAQARRHEVRPGLTGWAQINGRNAIGWAERLRMDAWYVDHRSVWLDAKILCLTVQRVSRREGITSAGEATMTLFKGEQDFGGHT